MKLLASIKERFGVLLGLILSLGVSLPLVVTISSYSYIRKEKYSTKLLEFKGGFLVMGALGIKREGFQ